MNTNRSETARSIPTATQALHRKLLNQHAGGRGCAQVMVTALLPAGLALQSLLQFCQVCAVSMGHVEPAIRAYLQARSDYSALVQGASDGTVMALVSPATSKAGLSLSSAIAEKLIPEVFLQKDVTRAS